MPRRGRPPKSWSELYEAPVTEEELRAYEAAVAATLAPSVPETSKRRRGRPRKPETERECKLQEACGQARWLMELQSQDPALQDQVAGWLLETRLADSSVWESELREEDWAKVSGPDSDFSRLVQSRILDKLVRRLLASEEAKLETVLRVAAHLAGLGDPDDVEAVRQYRDKGSTTERRRRAGAHEFRREIIVSGRVIPGWSTNIGDHRMKPHAQMSWTSSNQHDLVVERMKTKCVTKQYSVMGSGFHETVTLV